MWIALGVCSSISCLLTNDAHADDYAYNLYAWTHGVEGSMNSTTHPQQGATVAGIFGPAVGPGHAAIVGYTSAEMNGSYGPGLFHTTLAYSAATMEANGTPVDYNMFEWIAYACDVNHYGGALGVGQLVGAYVNEWGVTNLSASSYESYPSPFSFTYLASQNTPNGGGQFVTLNTALDLFTAVDTDVASPSFASVAVNATAHAEIVIPPAP